MKVDTVIFNGNPNMSARCVSHHRSLYVHTADLHRLFGHAVKKAVKAEVDSISRILVKHETFVDIRVAAQVSLRLHPVPPIPQLAKQALSVLAALKNPALMQVTGSEELPWDIRPGRVASKVGPNGSISVKERGKDA